MQDRSDTVSPPPTWPAGWSFTPPRTRVASDDARSVTLACCRDAGLLGPADGPSAEPDWVLDLWAENRDEADACRVEDRCAQGMRIRLGDGTDLVLHCPAPGLLVGEAPARLSPRLSAAVDLVHKPLIDEVAFGPDRGVLLVRQPLATRIRFCLSARFGNRGDRLSEARAAAERAPNQGLLTALSERTQWADRQPEDSREVLLRAYDLLHSRLRPDPEGDGAVSASLDAAGTADFNDLLPVIRGWVRIDPSTAWTLLITALRRFGSSPVPPRGIDLSQGAVLDGVAAPLLVRCLLSCWQALPSRGLLLTSLNLMQPYRDLLTAPDDAFVEAYASWAKAQPIRPPEAPPDDPAFVPRCLQLGELEALLALDREAGLREILGRDPVVSAADQARRIVRNAWNPDRRLLDDRSGEGDRRPGFHQALPLLDSTLPPDMRAAEQRLLKPSLLLSDRGLLPWIGEDTAPPPVLHPRWSLLITLAFHHRDEKADRGALCRALAEAAGRRLRSASLQEPDLPATAGLALETTLWDAPLSRQAAGAGSVALWVNRHRLGVTLGVVALLVLVLGLLTFALTTRTTLTDGQVETVSALAIRHYENGDYERSLAMFEDLKARGQGTRLRVDWRIGNIRFRQGRYEDALASYDLAVAPPYSLHPATLLNRALTLYRLGRMDEAASAYQDAEAELKQLYPTLARRAGIAADILARRSGANPGEEKVED